MNKIRLTYGLILFAILLAPVTALSFGHGQKLLKRSGALEGTSWETTTGDAGVTYHFKTNRVVTETWEYIDGKKETFKGTYTQNEDSVKMEFSDHTVNAKIESDGEWMRGQVILKDGSTSWSAKKK